MGLAKKRVLITCGPTWVPIDEMRVISNRSTGELGQQLAFALAKKGAVLTLLEGPVRQPLVKPPFEVCKYEFFVELDQLLKRSLQKHYDVVIQAAAVSDYQLATVYKGKLSSGRPALTLKLKPLPKLIATIKKRCPTTFLVGFKLAATTSKARLQEAAAGLFIDAACDLVVANTLKGGYRAYLLTKDDVIGQAGSRPELINQLIAAMEERL